MKGVEGLFSFVSVLGFVCRFYEYEEVTRLGVLFDFWDVYISPQGVVCICCVLYIKWLMIVFSF